MTWILIWLLLDFSNFIVSINLYHALSLIRYIWVSYFSLKLPSSGTVFFGWWLDAIELAVKDRLLYRISASKLLKHTFEWTWTTENIEPFGAPTFICWKLDLKQPFDFCHLSRTEVIFAHYSIARKLFTNISWDAQSKVFVKSISSARDMNLHSKPSQTFLPILLTL